MTPRECETFVNVLSSLLRQLTVAIDEVNAGKAPNPNQFATELQLAADMLNTFPTLRNGVVDRARKFCENISSNGEWGQKRQQFLMELRSPNVLAGRPVSMGIEAAQEQCNKWIAAFEREIVAFRTIKFIHGMYRAMRDDLTKWQSIKDSPVFARFQYLTLRLACDPYHDDAIGFMYFRLAEPQDLSVSDLEKTLTDDPAEIWPSLKRFVERLRLDVEKATKLLTATEGATPAWSASMNETVEPLLICDDAGRERVEADNKVYEAADPTNESDPSAGLSDVLLRVKAVYEWAISKIPGAEEMTIEELFNAIQHHSDMTSEFLEPLPNNFSTFGTYLRRAGIYRYNTKGSRTHRPSRRPRN